MFVVFKARVYQVFRLCCSLAFVLTTLSFFKKTRFALQILFITRYVRILIYKIQYVALTITSIAILVIALLDICLLFLVLSRLTLWYQKPGP